MSTRRPRRACVLTLVAMAAALEVALLGACTDGTTPDCADAQAGCAPDLSDAQSEANRAESGPAPEEASMMDAASDVASDVSSDVDNDARDADAQARDAQDG